MNDHTPHPDWIVLLLFALAMVTGAVGGCSAAAVVAMQDKRKMQSALFVAYAVVGAVFAALVMAYGEAFGLHLSTLQEQIGASLIAGIAAPTVLAGQNFGIRFMLRRLGFEVEWTIRKSKSDSGQ